MTAFQNLIFCYVHARVKSACGERAGPAAGGSGAYEGARRADHHAGALLASMAYNIIPTLFMCLYYYCLCLMALRACDCREVF